MARAVLFDLSGVLYVGDEAAAKADEQAHSAAALLKEARDAEAAGLDVLAVRTVRGLLRHLSDQGICVLFSSHVMQEVEALCDEIVIIARGRIAASGTPASLRRASGEQDLEEVFVKAIQGHAGRGGTEGNVADTGAPDA